MDILTLVLDLLLLVCVFIMGAVHGWKARERHAERIMNGLLDQFADEVEKEKENMVRIVIEKHNDMFYVYNKETNQFMGQGKSKKELEELLHKNFPGKRFGATEENLVEMGFKL